MPTANEALAAKTPLGSDLKVGVDAIAGASSPVTFTKYVRTVLPLDGFVFWVLSGLNTAPPTAPTTRIIQGSFHFSTDKLQDETETYGLSRCVFTSEQPIIQGFEYADPNIIYIGDFPDPQNPALILQFAFSQQNVYKQADTWHYIGDAVYPFMRSQIVNSAQDLPGDSQIVSNSLPFWLSLNNYAPFYGFGNSIPLYPSHLVASNISPPFGSVHILPESTQALAAAPFLGRKSSHHQLTRETVKITFYGISNDVALSFHDCVIQYATDYGAIGQAFGILNAPVMRDEKVRQNELSIIAQKKSIEFEVSYYQNSARTIARQLIQQVIPSVTAQYPQAGTVVPGWPKPDPYAQPTYTG